jgi:hypothetical protein
MIIDEFRLTSVILHFHQFGLCFTTSFLGGLFSASTGRGRKNRKTDSTYLSSTIMNIQGCTAAGSDEKQTETKQEKLFHLCKDTFFFRHASISQKKYVN